MQLLLFIEIFIDAKVSFAVFYKNLDFIENEIICKSCVIHLCKKLCDIDIDSSSKNIDFLLFTANAFDLLTIEPTYPIKCSYLTNDTYAKMRYL